MPDNEYTAAAAYQTYVEIIRSEDRNPKIHTVAWDILPSHIREIWLDAVDTTDEWVFEKNINDGE